jgi:hypothetical protein
LAKDNFFYDLQLRPQAITLHEGERGDSWHTFYFLIFHIFSVFANLNIRAQLGSDILGLQSELYNFHAISKQEERQVPPPPQPLDVAQPAPTRGKLAYVNKTLKIKVRMFQRLIMTDNGRFSVLRYKCFQYKFYTATEIMMVITNWKKRKIAQNGTHLLKLKKEIRSKANTMQKQHTTNSIHF